MKEAQCDDGWRDGGRESGGGQDRGWGGQKVKYNKCDRDKKEGNRGVL